MGLAKPEIHLKGWGKEEWIVNNDKYCLKIMDINQGKRCSIHYHRKKDETFSVKNGLLRLLVFPDLAVMSFEHLATVIEPSKLEKEMLKHAEEHILAPGDSFRIHKMLLHQFYGHSEEPAVFYEVSTTHEEEDSYRIVKGD